MSDSVGTTFRGKRRYHSLPVRDVPASLLGLRILSSLSRSIEKIHSRIFGNGETGLANRLRKKI